MALRLVELYLPLVAEQRVDDVFEKEHFLGIWKEKVSGNKLHVQVLIPSEETQCIIDLIEKEFSMIEGLRVIVLPVEATIPRPELPVKKEEKKEEPPIKRRAFLPKLDLEEEKISREELTEDIEDTIKFSWIYIILICLSTIVAAVGIMKDSVAIIIGAMVIAPLLGPNVALSFATTLGDIDLAHRAMKANLTGILTALVVAALLGFFVDIDIDDADDSDNNEFTEIESRTEVSLGDIVLALAAGGVAVFSFTSRRYSALIGVMVAVALLPPLVVFGLLMGSGDWDHAFGAMLLLLTNIIGINLAGVLTFLAQGIGPKNWWEEDKAKKATKIALYLWTILLAVLAIIVIISQRS